MYLVLVEEQVAVAVVLAVADYIAVLGVLKIPVMDSDQERLATIIAMLANTRDVKVRVRASASPCPR